MREIDRIAQEQFNGDMEKTLYALLFDGNLGGLDPHVDDLNKEEATFVYLCMRCAAIQAYGGEETYKKALKTEKLAAKVDMTTDEARNCQCNPYRKKLLLEAGKLFGAVLLPIFVALCLRKLGVGYGWIYSVQAILIGLCAINTAKAALSILRFHRLKKLLVDIPETRKDSVPTFDECIAHCQHIHSSGKTNKTCT